MLIRLAVRFPSVSTFASGLLIGYRGLFLLVSGAVSGAIALWRRLSTGADAATEPVAHREQQLELERTVLVGE